MSLVVDQEYARQIIHAQVWGGFENQNDILWDCLQASCDSNEPGDEDVAWVKQQVASAWKQKLEAEKSWPLKTELDRLEDVFARLRAEGLIALHRAGGDMSGGLQEAKDFREAAGDRKEQLVGYCFYHSQDLDRAVANGQLFLAFGAIGSSGDDIELRKKKNIAVGMRVVDLSNEAGFIATWSGDLGERISVNLGQWRKRSV